MAIAERWLRSEEMWDTQAHDPAYRQVVPAAEAMGKAVASLVEFATGAMAQAPEVPAAVARLRQRVGETLSARPGIWNPRGTPP